MKLWGPGGLRWLQTDRPRVDRRVPGEEEGLLRDTARIVAELSPEVFCHPWTPLPQPSS